MKGIIWITTVAIFMIFVATITAVLGQRSEPLEPGPKLQVWQLRNILLEKTGQARIRVFKFQIKDVMVCKAVYIDREREFRKDSISPMKSDEVPSLGLSIGVAALGDVPCE